MNEKAEVLNEWSGWVYYDDEYYPNVEELVEELLSKDEEVPEYVCVCKEIPFQAVDIQGILERIGRNGYDEIVDRLEGVKELEEAINDFNELNRSLVSYLPDYTKKVKLAGIMAEELRRYV